MIEIDTEVAIERTDHYVTKTEHVRLVGAIPEPVDAESLIVPEQIETGDRIEVFHGGFWCAATVLGRPADPRDIPMLVEITLPSGLVRRRLKMRSLAVPQGCGQTGKHERVEAIAWAAVVWAALQRHAAGAAPRRDPDEPCMACGGDGAVDVDVVIRGEHATRTVACDACVPDDPDDAERERSDGDPDGCAEARWEPSEP